MLLIFITKYILAWSQWDFTNNTFGLLTKLMHASNLNTINADNEIYFLQSYETAFPKRIARRKTISEN